MKKYKYIKRPMEVADIDIDDDYVGEWQLKAERYQIKQLRKLKHQLI